MGLIEQVFSLVFGSGRNAIKETAEVFRPNAEAQAERDHGLHSAALRQFGIEFLTSRRGGFDRFMDGLNRVPRPALALGTLGLFVAAMVDPVWFAARMAGIALVPEPLWWLLGAIVSFYFGARHQAKGQDFQRDLTARMGAALPEVLRQIETVETSTPEPATVQTEGNAALDEWAARRRDG
ncbi:holin family protein [Marivita sp. S6314]|uniref:holin family protein n=1 Tax=Marivita sp. S6314 TaxID=2926406 RepID=UPI001FF1F174|nr:holin family protein [Marivita sp. S6314]MCK0150968.1 holin family protein [Marivita sp. S6314]